VITSGSDTGEIEWDEVDGDQPDIDPPPPPSRHRIARVVGAVGRLMMTSGVVILLLVAYQLWGTNLQTAKSQDELADEYAALVTEPEQADATTTTEAPASTATTDPSDPSDPSDPTAPPETTPAETAPTVAPPAAGEVIGSFTIPAIGRTTPYYAVEGTGIDQLKRGAAHYPGTPLPGQAGNASVAGHRTTYGAPLHDVDDLVAGDEIFWTTPQGEFTYEVVEIIITDPHDTSVIQPQNPTPDKPEGDDMLTLTACHPKFSAAERIIVHAKLVGNPVEKLPGQDEAAQQVLDELGDDAGGGEALDAFATEPALTFPGAWWGLVCMLLWGLTRVSALLLRRTRVPWILAYVIGTPLCLLVLYMFFESFSYEGFARSVGLNV
jgi:sortase A